MTSVGFILWSSLESIMSAAFWLGQTTFTNFYLRSLSPHSESLYSLGPIVAAQTIIALPLHRVRARGCLLLGPYLFAWERDFLLLLSRTDTSTTVN